MSNHDRRSEWTVLLGIGLVGLGIWLFLSSFAGWIVAPIAAIIRVASRVIWPLILIGLGVLLVLRARGGGWAPSGRPLYRSREERMIAGVLGGVAKWLGVNADSDPHRLRDPHGPHRSVGGHPRLRPGRGPAPRGALEHAGGLHAPDAARSAAGTAPPAPPVPPTPQPKRPPRAGRAACSAR